LIHRRGGFCHVAGQVIADFWQHDGLLFYEDHKVFDLLQRKVEITGKVAYFVVAAVFYSLGQVAFAFWDVLEGLRYFDDWPGGFVQDKVYNYHRRGNGYDRQNNDKGSHLVDVFHDVLFGRSDHQRPGWVNAIQRDGNHGDLQICLQCRGITETLVFFSVLDRLERFIYILAELYFRIGKYFSDMIRYVTRQNKSVAGINSQRRDFLVFSDSLLYPGLQ